MNFEQFHPAGLPPGGPYAHDVLTVGEPSMMGNEYGEQDERQISRVENTAFAGMNHPGVSQAGGLMMPPQGMNTMGMGPPGQPQMNDNGKKVWEFDKFMNGLNFKPKHCSATSTCIPSSNKCNSNRPLAFGAHPISSRQHFPTRASSQ